MALVFVFLILSAQYESWSLPLSVMLGTPIAVFGAILGLWIALWWCYFAVGWGLVGATIGKRIFGLRIVDHQGRSPIGLSRAFLRLAAYSVSSVTLGMGHLLVVLRPDRRALESFLALYDPDLPMHEQLRRLAAGAEGVDTV